MDKYGIMNEKELMAFVNHFSIEPFSNIERYVMLSLLLCKDEPKKRNKYMVGCWNGGEHDAIKGTYKELCRECDGDISKMIERCKECKKRSISTHPKRGYPFTFLTRSS